MYRFDPHSHQAGQVLGEEAPPKTLAWPSGGPVCTGQKNRLSQGHKSQPQLDHGTTRSHQWWRLDRRPRSARRTTGFPWMSSQLPSSRAPLLGTPGSRQPSVQPKGASGPDTLGQSPAQSRGTPTLCSPRGLLQATFSLAPSPCLSPAVLRFAKEVPQFHTSSTGHLV